MDRQTLHIAYACNGRYAEQTMVSMVSLLENNRGADIVLHLIEDHICARHLACMRKAAASYGQTLQIESLEALAGDALPAGIGRHPRTIYAKLFLEQACPADRILYLDSDTAVLRPLLPLWEMEPEDAWIAGVRMPYSGRVKKRLGLDADAVYVCDGVLLINLKEWRKRRVKERCLDYIRKQDGRPHMQSEGVLNYVCRGHVMELAPAYNLMSGMILWNSSQISRLYRVRDYYTEEQLQEARREPAVVHYLQELYLRPWLASSDHPYKNKYLYYRRLAGFEGKPAQGRLGVRTGMVRVLNGCLPFGVFLCIYRIVKGLEKFVKAVMLLFTAA